MKIRQVEDRCALCQHSARLQDSHLLPQALYKHVRGDGTNPHPLHIAPQGWHQSSFQDKAYLLCMECEQRLHRNGENWVLKNLLRKDGKFLLWDKVTAHSESLSSDRHTIYRVKADGAVDFDALAYFAASVIWKAAAYPWRGKGEEITLGTSYEQFRGFLLGKQSFPDNAVLIVDITRPENRVKAVLSGPATTRGDKCFRHWFMTPGVVFEIAIGKLMPSDVRRLCALRNRIIVSSNHEETFRRAYDSMGR